MEIQELKTELDKGILRRAYIFWGPEDFLIQKYVKNIEALAMEDALAQMNKDVIEGDVQPDGIREKMQTLPFMAKKRLLIIKKTGLFAHRNKQNKEKDIEEITPLSQVTPKTKKEKIEEDVLIKLLQEQPDHCILLFLEETITKTHKRIKAIEKNGAVVAFEYQKSPYLIHWMNSVLKEHHIRIRKDAAELLLAYSEPNMHYIFNELQKLHVYAMGRGEINQEDVRNICTKNTKTVIFELMDMISGKNEKRAIAIFHDLLQNKEPVQKIFAMISNQLRLVLHTKILLSEGKNREQVVGILKVHPFVGEKMCKMARQFNQYALQKALEESYYMDIVSKTTYQDSVRNVELFLIRFIRSV